MTKSKREREAPDLERMMVRMCNALVKRCERGELEALEALQNLQDEAHSALTLGVLYYRQSPAQASWTDIGRILGTSRQSAHERFGRFVDMVENALAEDQASQDPEGLPDPAGWDS